MHWEYQIDAVRAMMPRHKSESLVVERLLKTYEATGDRQQFLGSRMQRFGDLAYEIAVPPEVEGVAWRAEIDGVGAVFGMGYRGAGGADDEAFKTLNIAPTYVSADGEFRGRVRSREVFEAYYTKAATSLAPLERVLAELVRSGELVLRTQASGRLPPGADDSLPLRMLATALALDEGLRLATDTTTLKAYVQLLARLTNRPPVRAALKEAARTDGRVNPIALFTSAPPVGCKLTPLSVGAIEEPGNLVHREWLEAAATRAASNLVLNLVAPGAGPLAVAWSLVKARSACLYENEANVEKLAGGDPPRERIEGALANRAPIADLYTALLEREAAGRIDGLSEMEINHKEADIRVAETTAIKIALEHGKTPYTYMTPTAASRLESKREAMSGASMLQLMENAGTTLGSVVDALLDPCTPANTKISLFEMFYFESTMHSVVFQTYYNIHCLHSAAHVAHCDLHCNNITINSLEFPIGDDAPLMIDTTVYVLGGREYVFPDKGWTRPCLIDFSRAVLGPQFDLGARTDRAAFLAAQNERVYDVLMFYEPTAVKKHEAALRQAISTNFRAVFPALCAVDLIDASTSLLHMYEMIEPIWKTLANSHAFWTTAASHALQVRSQALGLEVPMYIGDGEQMTGDIAYFYYMLYRNNPPDLSLAPRAAAERMLEAASAFLHNEVRRIAADPSAEPSELPGALLVAPLFGAFLADKADTEMYRATDLYTDQTPLTFDCSDPTRYPACLSPLDTPTPFAHSAYYPPQTGLHAPGVRRAVEHLSKSLSVASASDDGPANTSVSDVRSTYTSASNVGPANASSPAEVYSTVCPPRTSQLRTSQLRTSQLRAQASKRSISAPAK